MTTAPPFPDTHSSSRLWEHLRSARAGAVAAFRAPREPLDPASALYQRIRRRLTLLYTAVLAATLLLASGIIYTAMQQTVLAPAQTTLRQAGARLATRWSGTGGSSCPVPAVVAPSRDQFGMLIACYDPHGRLVAVSRDAATLPAFTANALVRQALASITPVRTSGSSGGSGSSGSSGSSYGSYGSHGGTGNGTGSGKPPTLDSTATSMDQIETGGNSRTVLRGAWVVRDDLTGQLLGVVQVGLPIGGELRALDTLGFILLGVDAFVLVVSAAGGFFLAGRALAPARLAYARQQSFIADVSHELRTPLTLLRADADVLLRGRSRLDPDDAALLEDIAAETQHIATLATNLLTLARLDAHSTLRHPEREVVDLADIATGVVRRVRMLAEQRGITVTSAAPPGALVAGDTDLLEQAALILVDNAIAYNTVGGSVTVAVERAPGRVLTTTTLAKPKPAAHAATSTPSAPGTLALVVRDTGMGIAPEHLPHLGERFYRPDAARSHAAGGAGLGIAIARRIASLLGGSLTYESTPGQGTTARLRFPALRSADGSQR